MDGSREAISVDDAITRLEEVEPGPGLFGELLGRGDAIVRPLEVFLRGPTRSVPHPRRFAAEVLAAIGSPAAVSSLRRSLADSIAREQLDPVLADAERTVGSAIAEHLGSLEDRESVELLLAALKKRGCLGCIRALGRLGDRRALPMLAERLNDDGSREAAMEALRRFGHIALSDVSRVLLHRWERDTVEPPTRVSGRAAAATLLGELKMSPAQLALVWSLLDPSSEVRLAAARALASFGPEVGAVALPELLDQLGSERWLDGDSAGEAIAALGREGVASLATAVERPASGLIRRRRAVEILGRIGGDEALPALSISATDPDPPLRLATAIALARMTSLDALPTLDRLGRDDSPEIRSRAAEALGHHGHLGLMLVVPMLGDPDDHVRETVRGVVSRVGRAAVPALVAIRDGRLRGRGGWRAEHRARGEATALLREAT